MSDQLSLFGRADAAIGADRSRPIPMPRRGSSRAIPDNNVVLEASAGTGKTSVLVTRYVNLLTRGVDPANILAITFTRKAAAEMRERIIRELRRAAGAVDVRPRPLGGDPRSARRHPDQHDRRFLPVAAARVPARGGSRSRLRHGGRDRGAAARRSVARQVARDLRRAARSASPTWRSCSRSSGLTRTREGSPTCCSGVWSPGTCSIGSSSAAPRTSTPTPCAAARSSRSIDLFATVSRRAARSSWPRAGPPAALPAAGAGSPAARVVPDGGQRRRPRIDEPGRRGTS